MDKEKMDEMAQKLFGKDFDELDELEQQKVQSASIKLRASGLA